jgi:hypothetical protein
MRPDGPTVHLRCPAKPASRLGSDIDLVGAFGALLSRDGKAIIYGPENGDVRGRCPVLEAVEITERSTGRAFFVNVPRDVLALDGDDPGCVAGPARTLVDLMRTANLRPVLLASGGPGRAHLFARVHDRKLLEQFADLGKRLGFDHRQSIRPPLSRHRLGGRSRLLEPQDPLDALVALAPTTRPPRLLRGAMRRLAFAGERDRSRCAARLVMALVNRGWSIEGVRAFLMDPKCVAGAKLQEISDQSLRRRRVERLYRSAEKRIAESPSRRSRPSVDADLMCFVAHLEALEWRGLGGASLYVAARMCVAIAAECGDVILHFGCRRLAEHLGVDWGTANRWCQALLTLGLLTLVKKGGGRWPHTWQLCVLARSAPSKSLFRADPRPYPQKPHLPAPTGRVVGEVWGAPSGGGVAPVVPCLLDPVAADVFGPFGWFGTRGLGFPCWRALVLVEQAEAIREGELSTRLGPLMSRGVDPLLDLAILQQEGDWYRRGATTLEEVARRLRTLGTRSWKRAQHRAQRAEYRKRLDGAAATRGGDPVPAVEEAV